MMPIPSPSAVRPAPEAQPLNECPFDPDPRYAAGLDVWLVSDYDDVRKVPGDNINFSNIDASSSHLMGEPEALGRHTLNRESYCASAAMSTQGFGSGSPGDFAPPSAGHEQWLRG